MTNQKEKSQIDDLSDRVQEHGWILKKQVLPALDKVEKTLDENMAGIKLASLLNSRIIAVVLGGMVAAGIYLIAKTGGGL